MMAGEALGDDARQRQFVDQCSAGKADRECANRRVGIAAQQRQQHGGVHAPGQKQAERDIRAHMLAHDGFHERVETLFGFIAVDVLGTYRQR